MVKATNTGGNFKPTKLPKPQTTVARCYSLIDIGTVPHIYQGKLQGKVHRIFVTFELPKLLGVFNEEKGEQPFVVSEEFTLSTKDNANFTKFVAAWRAKPFSPEEVQSFDPVKMVGKTALIQLVHKRKKDFRDQKIADDDITNENTNLKIGAIMKRPNEMDIPENINPYFVWDWEKIENGEEKFDHEKFEQIPNFLKSKIEESDEYKKYATPAGESAAPAADQSAGSGGGSVSEDEW